MAKKKEPKYKPHSNRELYDAMMELRRSSASQRHQDERRKGSRGAKKGKAIKDSSS